VLDAIERLVRDRQSEDRPGQNDPTVAVRRLAALRDEGTLTDAEFEAKKRAVLGLE